MELKLVNKSIMLSIAVKRDLQVPRVIHKQCKLHEVLRYAGILRLCGICSSVGCHERE